MKLSGSVAILALANSASIVDAFSISNVARCERYSFRVSVSHQQHQSTASRQQQQQWDPSQGVYDNYGPPTGFVVTEDIAYAAGSSAAVESDPIADLYNSPPEPRFQQAEHTLPGHGSVSSLYGPPPASSLVQAIEEAYIEHAAANPAMNDLYGSSPPQQTGTGEPKTFQKKVYRFVSNSTTNGLYDAPAADQAPTYQGVSYSTPAVTVDRSIGDLYGSSPPQGAAGTAPKTFAKKVYKSVSNSTTNGLYSPPDGVQASPVAASSNTYSSTSDASIGDFYGSSPPKPTGSAPKMFTKKVYKSVSNSTTNGLYGPPGSVQASPVAASSTYSSTTGGSVANLYGSSPPKPTGSAPKTFTKKVYKSVSNSTTNGLYGPPGGGQAAATATSSTTDRSVGNLYGSSPPMAVAGSSPKSFNKKVYKFVSNSTHNGLYGPPSSTVSEATQAVSSASSTHASVGDLYGSSPPKPSAGFAPKAFTKKVYQFVSNSTTNGLYGPPPPQSAETSAVTYTSAATSYDGKMQDLYGSGPAKFTGTPKMAFAGKKQFKASNSTTGGLYAPPQTITEVQAAQGQSIERTQLRTPAELHERMLFNSYEESRTNRLFVPPPRVMRRVGQGVEPDYPENVKRPVDDWENKKYRQVHVSVDTQGVR